MSGQDLEVLVPTQKVHEDLLTKVGMTGVLGRPIVSGPRGFPDSSWSPKCSSDLVGQIWVLNLRKKFFLKKI